MLADTRCSGGRQLVQTQMDNHQRALRNVKSTYSTQPKPVRVAKPRPFTAKQSHYGSGDPIDAFAYDLHVRKTENMKNYTNTETPQTFVNLRDKLAMNKAVKLGDFHDREHNRNLQALQKRL